MFSNDLIVEIYNVTPKSLDLYFNYYFEEFNFKIKSTTKNFSIILPKESLVKNSLDFDTNSKTLILDTPLEYDEYFLSVFFNTTLIKSFKFIVSEFKRPLPNLTSLGNRILKISFNSPVYNLSHVSPINSDIYNSKFALTNFYINLFDSDISLSGTSVPKWPGFILVDQTTSYNSYNFFVTSDLKTIFIQSPIPFPLNTTNSILIGFSRLYESTHSLKDSLNFEIPIHKINFHSSYAPFSIEPLFVNILSPNKISIVFNRPMCLSNIEALNSFVDEAISPTSTETNIKFSSVEYFNNNPSILILSLPLNYNFSPGSRTFKIGSFTDAFNLKTKEKSFTSAFSFSETSIYYVSFYNNNKNILLFHFNNKLSKNHPLDISNLKILDKETSLPLEILDIIPICDYYILKITFNMILTPGIYEVIPLNVYDFLNQLIPSLGTLFKIV